MTAGGTVARLSAHVAPAHELGELVMDHAHQRLARRQAADHLLRQSPLP